jgi:hypothetical protein
MCMMIYIGSEKALPLISWKDDAPAFNVSELSEGEAVVKKQFSMPYVYYVGSHEGCGCGFQAGQYPQFEDEEKPLKEESLFRFSKYLKENKSKGERVEIYSCWDGAQGGERKSNRRLTASQIAEKDFWFYEQELIEIIDEV